MYNFLKPHFFLLFKVQVYLNTLSKKKKLNNPVPNVHLVLVWDALISYFIAYFSYYLRVPRESLTYFI